MTDNKNVNGELGQTNSNCDDILNTPEDLKEDNPSEEDLSCFIEEYDWGHGFREGDVVWYHLSSSLVIKRSKIVEMKATEGAIAKDSRYDRFLASSSILRTLGTLGTVWQPQYLYSTKERSKGRITESNSGNLSPLTSHLSPLISHLLPLTSHH